MTSENNTMTGKEPISVNCRHCGQNYTLLVWKEKFEEWQGGSGYIQDVLSDNTPAERELRISGTCDACWQSMFGPCDDDEECEEESGTEAEVNNE